MRRLVSARPAAILIACALAAVPLQAQSKNDHTPPGAFGRTQQDVTLNPPPTTTVQQNSDPTDTLGMAAIYSADIFQQGLAVVGKPTLLTGGQAAAPTSPSDSASLTYTPSVTVELSTRHKLQKSLLKTTENEAVQKQIRKTIGSDDIWLQFASVLRKAGFSTLNLADVTAAYYVITWEVVNSNEANANAKAIQAVRKTVVSGMQADSRFAKMSDAEKQEAASLMAYMATVAADSVNQLHSSGKEDSLARLREQVHASVMAQGVDLDRLLLTDKGFIVR